MRTFAAWHLVRRLYSSCGTISRGYYGVDQRLHDVIVLGAGVQGSSTAYYLTQKAGLKDVLLLEQFPTMHARGSSHGNSRITRHAYPEPFFVKMMEEAYPMWSALEQESNTKLYEKTGFIALGKETEPYIEGISKNLRLHDIPHQILPAAEANKRYSKQLCLPEGTTCVHEEDGGILMASKAVAAYQKLFIAAGGVLLDEHPVTEIVPGREVVIRTPKGSFRTRKLVLTPGSWSPELLKTLSLQLPLEAIRTEALYWKTDIPEHFSKENFPAFLVFANSDEFYGLPIHEYPGLVKICYHHGEASHPEFCDSSRSSAGIKKVTNFIKEHFKGVADMPSVVEPCFYTMTPDSIPFMDSHPVHSNIIIGTGFSGHGFKLSPVVGKILSELTMELSPSYDLSPFRLNRF